MPRFKFIEPERTSSDESDSDSDDSGVPPPPDPNDPNQLRLTRRENVLLITKNNTIPQMEHPGQMPYCIWYPGFATEDTYRDLVRQYPQLRYNVGRACAVGGFLNLYLELDLLPDVNIAEEAREAGEINNSEGSTTIFNHIMSQPLRYRIMDDYGRKVNLENPEAGACLNGDTALRPSLVEDGREPWVWADYFDITEDWPWHLEKRYRRERINLPRQFAYLLHSPLPRDLPTTRKDTLIVMAAYEGNVDRYARLRRPAMVRDEEEAVIHGIYHSTTFAKYWSLQEARHSADFRVHQSITARFIMVNDLSWLPEEPDPTDIGDRRDYPHLIWHPLIPREETLREIVRRRPNHIYLKESVALAAIAGNYQGTYDALDIKPNFRLWQQAKKSQNGHYAADLRRRAAEQGLEDALPDHDDYAQWYWQEAIDLFPTTTRLVPIQYTSGIVEGYGGGSAYSRWEVEANAAEWELYIASSDELRDRADRHAETADWGMWGLTSMRR